MNSYRGRGRGRGVGSSSSTTNVVDHRPKQLLIAGFNVDEKEEMLQHFMVSYLLFIDLTFTLHPVLYLFYYNIDRVAMLSRGMMHCTCT